ncbi:hypothetical protein BDV26DRAFT_253560 [Aspergillus bertholletiae]|uniref:Rhodopsin domain-containing protein n=1 Tax=Aspergillus bertholletiae TaxID=1226010 RepID=A0A5N7BL04_9EURO|nr:hypothetical protein BDV26DRAFT_253560 [Aspergillus bertholletiae]
MDTSMPLGGRSLAIFTVAVVMMCLSVLAVLLRVFVRSYLVRAFGWDDTLMVAALGLFTFLNICCIIGTENGIGHKIEDFKSLDTLKRAMLWWWLGQMLYVWSSAVAKVSIALALIRLTVRKIHMIILWTVIAVVIAIGLMFWFVLLFDCQPVSYFWSRVDVTKSGTCLSTDILLAIAYLYSAITIFCDFTLGIFPVFLIWSLQMNGRTKAALGGILSMGAVASVAVVIRLPFLQNYKDTDFLYSTYQIAIWSVMETGLAIIAGSLITLRPLFRWFLDGTVSFPQSDRRGKYPLSSLTGNTSKTAASRDPKYWRPDVTSGDTSTFVVTSVSAPDRLNDSDNSSQEVLYPVPDPWFPQNGVNVHKSFRVGEETP